MKRSVNIILLFFFAFQLLSGQVIKTDSVNVTPFEKVYVYSSGLTPGNLIIMISGDGGWKYGVPEFAMEFSRMNALVVGVDILHYYRYLRRQNKDCYMVSSDFVELATAIERKYNFRSYFPPVIMGYSSGATLVYAILAQSRPGTFTGGISLGFCPDIPLPRMMCQVNGLTEKVNDTGKGFLLLPDARLGNKWVVLQGPDDKVCNFTEVSEFVRNCGNSKLIPCDGVGHSFSRWSDFMPQWKAAYTEMIKKPEDSRSTEPSNPGSDLPIIVTRKNDPSDNNSIAFLYSGDGGWYSFEQAIATRLSNNGVPVIGIDMKKYLWTRKTPDQVATDLQGMIKYYLKLWNRQNVVLIGYSQGAEVIPFIFTRLPEEIRLHVSSLVMLSPELFTDFEIHVSNMMGLGNKKNTFDVVAELSKVKDPLQLFIFGEGEKTTLPDLVKGKNVEVVRVPGDHHFKGNSGLIVQTMKDKKAF